MRVIDIRVIDISNKFDRAPFRGVGDYIREHVEDFDYSRVQRCLIGQTLRKNGIDADGLGLGWKDTKLAFARLIGLPLPEWDDNGYGMEPFMFNERWSDEFCQRAVRYESPHIIAADFADYLAAGGPMLAWFAQELRNYRYADEKA
jgi:hypothetical protein